MTKQVVTHAYNYTRPAGTYDVSPTAATCAYLDQLFSYNDDVWVEAIEVRPRQDLHPILSDVYMYVELYEVQEEKGSLTQKLIARVPATRSGEVYPDAVTVNRVQATLPPFRISKHRRYYLLPRYMSATTDLATVAELATVQTIIKMRYSEKPIDFSQLPPYRAEIPTWIFIRTSTNTSGVTSNLSSEFYLYNKYRIEFVGGVASGTSAHRLYFNRPGSTVPNNQHRVLTRTSTALDAANDYPKDHAGNVTVVHMDVPDAITYTARLRVSLKPVIP